jgi:hypothetical protein
VAASSPSRASAGRAPPADSTPAPSRRSSAAGAARQAVVFSAFAALAPQVVSKVLAQHALGLLR